VPSNAFKWATTDVAYPQGVVNANIYYVKGDADSLILRFKSESDARSAHDAVVAAFEAWKAKFPEAVLK
jgi:hypothetical protein